MLDYKRKFIKTGAEGYSAWLHDAGSLTRRIQQRSQEFSVQTLHSGLAKINADEAEQLKVNPNHLAFTREVYLWSDGKPVVFAHSTCAPQHIRGAWRAMKGLGNRPLGTLLFSHPQIFRHPLSFKKLRTGNPLYQKAISAIRQPPSELWARRSLFFLEQAPLLVTEVFLPMILEI